MRTLLASRADPASVNLRDHLLRMADWKDMGRFRGLPVREHAGVRMVEIGETHLEADMLDRELAAEGFDATEGIVVLSKHKAASGKPALTAHPIGNYRDADFGGYPKVLTPTMPHLMARLLRGMHARAKEAGIPHDVTYEATHHGPTLGVPACFVEIGTTDEHWTDRSLGELVASAVLEAVTSDEDAGDAPVLLGIGGSHYAPRMTDLARKGRAAFGHLIPAYQLQDPLDARVILQAVEGTPGIQGYYLSERAEPKALPELLQALGGLELGRFTEEDLPDAS